MFFHRRINFFKKRFRHNRFKKKLHTTFSSVNPKPPILEFNFQNVKKIQTKGKNSKIFDLLRANNFVERNLGIENNGTKHSKAPQTKKNPIPSHITCFNKQELTFHRI